jgi:aspartate-semialdehyde dehydrogenase
MKAVKLAIVGASGLVGSKILELLADTQFPLSGLRLFASPKSAGRTVNFANRFFQAEIPIENLLEQTSSTLSGLDLAIFSAGSSVSTDWAPVFSSANCLVIDNSSAWRMDVEVPLIVPEINPNSIQLALQPAGKLIIANPNCSTMVIIPVLAALHQELGLKSMIISTYQSVSGLGNRGIEELRNQAQESAKYNFEQFLTGMAFPLANSEVFPAPIGFNVIPYAGALVDDASYETDEEQKLRNETRKILNLPDLSVSALCVRVPVFVGHSLAANLAFERPISPELAVDLLRKAPGVELMEQLPERYLTRPCDLTAANSAITAFPTPLLAVGKPRTLVGRIRQDYSQNNTHGIALFATSDNLLKGAALNAIQIARLALKYL